MIKNYMEDLVLQVLTDLLKNNSEYKNICKCDICRDDMMARTLNRLKPFYITTETGKFYGEYLAYESQNIANIITEVVKSIEVVSKNPRHNLKK